MADQYYIETLHPTEFSYKLKDMDRWEYGPLPYKWDSMRGNAVFRPSDAAHIAAFSPNRCLKMLEALDAAKECLMGFQKHEHPAMSWNNQQVGHAAYDDFDAALKALEST